METTPISPQMRMYYRRKEAGLCVNCGKPLDIAGVKCSKCHDRANKDRRELISWYKENRICPTCRKNSLFGDEKMCIECSAKRYTQRMSRYNANPEKFKEKDRIEQKASIREEAITDYAFIAVKLRQMRDIKRVLSAVTNLKSRNV